VRACGVALGIAVAVALAGCGGDGGKAQLTVSAASSLTSALIRYGGDFASADARFSFAGSDELAAQIRQGARPDVFASADTALPDELYQRGLVTKPVVFARNRLVLAVPADRTGIHSVRDLAGPGVTIAVGSASVPVGIYTRHVLSGLPEPERSAILANVGSNEPDVAGIVGKLTQGAVDAGFVYITDVEAARGALRAIELPARLRPSVAYAAATVKGAEQPRQAHEFIDGLLSGPGRRALRKAGFEPPPT
jgi:molybdate transport system substrate-binding protein